MAFQSQRSSSSTGLLSPGLFNFDHLETHVQSHLKNVYSTLSIGVLAAAGGAYIHARTGAGQWHFLTLIASMGLLFWLASTKGNFRKEDVGKRVAIFTGFCGTIGISLGPLLDMAIMINPVIISTALAGTAVVFIGFTMAALLTRSRTFLYMGGFLMSTLMWLTFAGLANIFFRSQMIFDMYIYGILFVFSGFVLYDTQLIVEKRRRGDQDFIWHSVDLFLDAINIFRTLLIILAKKDRGNENNNNKKGNKEEKDD